MLFAVGLRVTQERMQFLPTAVFEMFARQGRKLRRLNAVNDRSASAWRDVIKPAARSDRVFVQFQDSQRQRIAAAKIVEQPSIEFLRNECVLDFYDALLRSPGSHLWNEIAAT